MPENGEVSRGFFMEKDWDFDLHYDIILVIIVTVQHLEARDAEYPGLWAGRGASHLVRNNVVPVWTKT